MPSVPSFRAVPPPVRSAPEPGRRRRASHGLALAAMILFAPAGPAVSLPAPARPAVAPAPAKPGPATPAPAASAAPKIVVLGDSLSAGYGIRVEENWVTLLQQRLAKEGYGYRVVNASVSGETTGGGLARLPRVLSVHRPAIVIVELGANDGLRGLPLPEVAGNLDRIVTLSKQAGAQVLLAGMRIPTNYGAKYTEGFHATFGEVAKRHRVPLVPFFLAGVAEDERNFQPDRIHPTAAVQARLLDNVWPTLKPMLRQRQAAAASST